MKQPIAIPSEWLESNAVVPVDIPTTALLIEFVKATMARNAELLREISALQFQQRS